MLIAIIIIFITVFIFIHRENEMKKMSKVAPDLYVSDWVSATNEKLLRRNGITQIICITMREKDTEDFEIYARLGIKHTQYHIDNRPDAPINLIFPNVVSLCEGETTLIHCQMGISRSVTVAAARIMIKNNLSADTALARIRSVRPIINPNPGFIMTLHDLECRLKGLC